MTEATLALYHFDENKGQIAPDSGPEGLHGQLADGTRWHRAGRFGAGLTFNGVDCGVSMPHHFASGEQRIALYLCPTTAPEDPVEEVFGRVFEGQDYPFRFWGREWLATKSYAGRCEWGPWQRDGAHPEGTLQPRGVGNQKVFCTDSVDSGFRQQSWLRREDGKFFWWYASPTPEGLYYGGLTSQSIVWQKGVWTHVAVEVSVREQQARLFINGHLEAAGSFPAALPTHHFILGASWRDGVPFAGLIDELEITSRLPPEARLFPEGQMAGPFRKVGESLELALGFVGYNLQPGEDRAGPETEGPYAGTAAQRLALSAGERGLRADVSLGEGCAYEISVQVRGSAGRVQLAAGPSIWPSLAGKTVSTALTGNWTRLALEVVPVFGHEMRVFVIFDEPGEYVVDELRVVKR